MRPCRAWNLQNTFGGRRLRFVLEVRDDVPRRGVVVFQLLNDGVECQDEVVGVLGANEGVWYAGFGAARLA